MSSSSEDESMDLNESSTESDSQPEEGNNSNEDAQHDEHMNTFEANELKSDSNDESADIAESEDSSDDGEDEDDEEEKEDTQNNKGKTKEALIREEVINRLKSHIGKQLYVRFNARIPEKEEEFQQKVKALSPLITKGIKPRQKHARFCLVEFETQKDRDATYVKLRAASNKKEPALKGIVVSIPRTENEEFVEQLVQKRLKAKEKKIAKNRLKKAIKQAKKKNSKTFTTTVLVRDLPGNASMAEIRSLFPNAVDVQMKQVKSKQSSLATITLPTSKDAREAVKQKLSLGGTRLRITFHGGKVQGSKVKKSEIAEKTEETTEKTAPKKKIRKVLCA